MERRSEQAPNWKLPCPHEECSYYVDVAVDTGTGETAANLMDDHTQVWHKGERFPAWYKGDRSD